jgi:hypothetical protein
MSHLVHQVLFFLFINWCYGYLKEYKFFRDAVHNTSFTHYFCSRVLTWLQNVAQTPFLESASELYRPSNCCLLAKLVPTFADRGCHVVSVTSLWSYSQISRPEPLLFLSSSSSVVLTRLSGPRSRPSQKIYWQPVCLSNIPGACLNSCPNLYRNNVHNSPCQLWDFCTLHQCLSLTFFLKLIFEHFPSTQEGSARKSCMWLFLLHIRSDYLQKKARAHVCPRAEGGHVSHH